MAAPLSPLSPLSLPRPARPAPSSPLSPPGATSSRPARLLGAEATPPLTIGYGAASPPSGERPRIIHGSFVPDRFNRSAHAVRPQRRVSTPSLAAVAPEVAGLDPSRPVSPSLGYALSPAAASTGDLRRWLQGTGSGRSAESNSLGVKVLPAFSAGMRQQWRSPASPRGASLGGLHPASTESSLSPGIPQTDSARYPGPWSDTRPCGVPQSGAREQRALMLGDLPPRPRLGIDSSLVAAERRGLFDHMAGQQPPKAWHRALQRPAKLDAPYGSKRRLLFGAGSPASSTQ